MGTKISLNVDEDVLNWFDRFKYEGEENFEISRTDVIHKDIYFYGILLSEGTISLMEKITYMEFICLLGAFNGWIPDYRTTPGRIKFSIREYDYYNPELSWNCEAQGIDKTKLLETVDEFSATECYALLDFACRFWLKPGVDVDEKLQELGLTKDKFKQAS